MVVLTFVFVWKMLSGGALLRAFLVILAAAASGIYWAARPYLVTFLFSAIFLWVLIGFRWKEKLSGDSAQNFVQLPRFWLILPALMAIWANSHGGFIVGFILLGIYGLDELVRWILALRSTDNDQTSTRWHASRLRGLISMGILMLMAVCLNPFGASMLLYPFKTAAIHSLTDFIQEWQPPDFSSRQVWPFMVLLLMTAVVLLISRQRRALSEMLLVVVFGALALSAARNIALFAVVAAPVLARHLAPIAGKIGQGIGLQPAAEKSTRTQARINLLLFSVFSFAAAIKVISVLPAAYNQAEIRSSMPVDAVEYLRIHQPPGRLFNAYNWGGYLLWALPEHPVYIDGRSDLYDDELITEWLGVVRAQPGWQDVLDRWDVRLILVEPDTPLVSELEGEGWEELYADEVAVLWGK